MKKKWILSTVILTILISSGLLVKKFTKKDAGTAQFPVAVAQRGGLVIDVLEGGNIQALNYLEFRNEVKLPAGVKILEIIEEGYMVTPEDVEAGKVLVRLDQSPLEDAIVDHDVAFQQTEGAFAEAKQSIEIQESNALSDVKAVRQRLRFALLDFQKFVGAQAAEQILKKLKLPYDAETLQNYEAEATSLIVSAFDSVTAESEEGSDAGTLNPSRLEGDNSLSGKVNFGTFLENEMLGDGEAEQKIRRMRDEALVAASQLAAVEESVEGAKRLHDREFITRQTLDNELLGLDKARLALQRTETELELFRDYEFPKEAEKMLSNYEEALLALLRTKRSQLALMSQAHARYRAAKRRYDLQVKQRQNLDEQLAGCVIRASLPGLVAYGGAKENMFNSRNTEGISSGATLRTGQPIITIPDMSRLGVEVNIHESHIKKIQLGQKVYITAESVPDRTLIGKVTKLAVLPDSNASRYNPSLKVYPATVEIDGTHDFLKPGMSAKVEIIVDELEDVTYVPVQTVFVENQKHFVFLKDGSGYKRQLVTIGANNNDFVEIREGVEQGGEVLLRMPDDYEPEKVQIASVTREIDPGSAAPAKKPAETEAYDETTDASDKGQPGKGKKKDNESEKTARRPALATNEANKNA